MAIQKILLITLSNIGDVVLTTPTLEALNKSYPNATIDIVCDKRSAALFEFCPYRQCIFIKEKNAGLIGNLKLIFALRKKNYDVAVDLRTDLLVKFVRAKRKFYKLSNHASLHLHSAEKHFSAIKEISKVTLPATTLWSSSGVKKKIKPLIAGFEHKKILALGLGANFAGKVWPVHCYVELSQALAAHFDVVVLLGNQNEKPLSEQFMAQSKMPTFDFSGKLTLIETYELLKSVSCFVGNDSGLGHLASAANIRTFTIFGVGNPARYMPWSKKAKYYQSPSENISQISTDVVAKLIIDDLNNSVEHSNESFENITTLHEE